MTSALHTGEELGGRSTAQAIALMRPPLVVELHERVEAALHRSAAREVLAAKLDPPVLVQDRPPASVARRSRPQRSSSNVRSRPVR